MSDRQEKEQQSWFVWVIAVLLFVVILVTISVLSAGEADAPTAPEPTVTPSPEPTITPSPSIEPSIVLPPVLASGQDEDFVFNVINVERDAPTTADGQMPEGEFTLVTLMVENVGDEPLGYSTFDVGAIDSTGVLWMSDNLDDSPVMVRPGSSLTGVVVFDTAVGTDLVAILATGSSAGAVATADGVEIPLP